MLASGTIPVMRPQLPPAADLVPYLRRIDETRYYSNHGQLLGELEQHFARHFGVSADDLAVIANGTVALSAALLAVGARPGSKCLVPSWTFVGSAAAIWAANLRPHFVDVRPDTWTLDPQQLMRRPDLSEVGAVMVVSPFGSPVETRSWDAFTDETGIPVIVDGAAAFDTVASIRSAAPGKSPIMISLHATKVFGIGEGGLVICTDRSVMRRLRQVCNFGVWGSPEGQILGYNGKLSEYHAAVGLAAYAHWPRRRERIAALTKQYVDRLSDVDGVTLLPGYGKGWVSCYCNVRTECEAAPVIAALRENGVETRRWWQSGVHVQHAYQSFSRDNLPVTVSLGNRVFGLPFYHDMSEADVDRVVSTLKIALASCR